MSGECNETVQNTWLADAAEMYHDRIVDRWLMCLRREGPTPYSRIPDDQLRRELSPTVDQMIGAFRSGNPQSVRDHTCRILSSRVDRGFTLPELERGLHLLEIALIYTIDGITDDPDIRLQAVRSASAMYHEVGLIVADVHQQLQTAQQARFTRVYELGAALTRTLDLDTVLQTAVETIAEAVHASTVAILLEADDSRCCEVRASYGMSPELALVLPDICLALEGDPDRYCACSSEAGILSAQSIKTDTLLSQWSDLLASGACRSIVCLPLMAAGESLGTLVVCMDDEHEFQPFEMDFLLGLAGHTATAVQNAKLYEEAKGKRELSLLLEAGKLFTSTLDPRKVLDSVARLAVESIDADYASVLLPDRVTGRLINEGRYASEGTAQQAFDALIRIWESETWIAPLGATGHVYRSGEPLLISDYSAYPDRLPELVGIIKSLLVVPIKLKGKIVGTFNLGSLHTNAFSAEDLSLAMGVADQAAVAIENARLYERERNIAETLQNSFLPEVLPSVPGYEIAVCYKAALTEAEMGGDFYDAFDVDKRLTALLVADVSGKGLSAAGYTAMGKYTVRAYALLDTSPGWVLRKSNAAFHQSIPTGMFVTAFYGVLDPTANSLTYASAGHNPPMLYSRRLDYITHLDVTGPGLGVMDDIEYGERVVSLEPGDMLLIYTDGATDVVGDSGRFNVEGLETVFRKCVTYSAQRAVSAVFSSVLNYSDGHLQDDVALMVLRRQYE